MCVVNGQFSAWFLMERGNRQGDPLSPYIYLLCAEIIAIRIRKNSGVIGIKVKDVEYKYYNLQRIHKFIGMAVENYLKM